MDNSKRYILIATIVVIVGAIYFINGNSVKRTGSNEAVVVAQGSEMKKEEKEKQYELAKEITTPDGFINTNGQPITISELVGKKVILVDFWTYSCINCQRTTPYLNAWYEKYRDKGLEIIGVHTPEFEFEEKYENVEAAAKKFGIQFPVVLDNDYSTWTAYKNRYWPRKYLIDIDGYIVYDHIGEGAYEETERRIQEALMERMSVLGEDIPIAQSVTSETPREDNPRSPEIYFGAARNSNLQNGRTGVIGIQNLTAPEGIAINKLYLDGSWNIQEEFAENKNNDAKIKFRYQAKDVYFVAGGEQAKKIRIFKDGEFICEQIVKDHTLYHLIEDSAYGEYTLEIIIETPGLRAFTFTFG